LHEALVTQRPRFQRWLQAASGDKRTLDRLIERVAMWAIAEVPPDQSANSQSKEKGQYLATGAELQQFDDLTKQDRDWETRRNCLFRAVIAASILFAVAAVTAWFQTRAANEQARMAIAKLSTIERQLVEAFAGACVTMQHLNLTFVQ
jgi:hypothetical protein